MKFPTRFKHQFTSIWKNHVAKLFSIQISSTTDDVYSINENYHESFTEIIRVSARAEKGGEEEKNEKKKGEKCNFAISEPVTFNDFVL